MHETRLRRRANGLSFKFFPLVPRGEMVGSLLKFIFRIPRRRTHSRPNRPTNGNLAGPSHCRPTAAFYGQWTTVFSIHDVAIVRPHGSPDRDKTRATRLLFTIIPGIIVCRAAGFWDQSPIAHGVLATVRVPITPHIVQTPGGECGPTVRISFRVSETRNECDDSSVLPERMPSTCVCVYARPLLSTRPRHAAKIGRRLTTGRPKLKTPRS